MIKIKKYVIYFVQHLFFMQSETVPSLSEFAFFFSGEPEMNQDHQYRVSLSVCIDNDHYLECFLNTSLVYDSNFAAFIYYAN